MNDLKITNVTFEQVVDVLRYYAFDGWAPEMQGENKPGVVAYDKGQRARDLLKLLGLSP